MNLRETLAAAWATPDLRGRILFLFAMFTVYIIGIHIPVPVPGVDPEKVHDLIASNAALGFINLFGGGALKKLSIFALGLNPYITSSIVMQLMTVGVPSLQKMQREEGEYGRRKINRITRWLTIVLCFFQSWGYTKLITSLASQAGASHLTFVDQLVIIAFWTAGAMFVLWLGEQIQEKGVGNGVSLMIFAGIIVQLPYQIHQLYQNLTIGQNSSLDVMLLAALFLGTIWIIVFFTQAQRRIPIHHMRRIPGRRAMGSQTVYLPLSINSAGVIPIIFAISLMYLPGTFAQALGTGSPIGGFFATMQQLFSPGSSILGAAIYTLMIFGFTYFYTAVVYNVEEMADNLKRSGAFVPGVRPGSPTRDYLDGVISRITLVGAAFLAFVALLQYWVPAWTNTINVFTLAGGTSLLIVVAVALDTMRQIESQVIMRGYEEVR
ncbi:MAG: preprotein translocase subunit SecY [Fimbriimonadia bacterium]